MDGVAGEVGVVDFLTTVPPIKWLSAMLQSTTTRRVPDAVINKATIELVPWRLSSPPYAFQIIPSTTTKRVRGY